MVPAKDRASKSPARWLSIGLVLALGPAQAGCSRFASRDPGPMLGRTIDTSETTAYRSGHASRSAAPPTSTLAEAGPAPADGALMPVDEVGLAIRPAATPAPAEAPESAVTLLPPSPVEPKGDAVLPTSSVVVPEAPAPSASPTRAAAPAVDAAQVVAGARASLDAIGSYQVAMRRQERVNGSLQPEEDVILAVRRNPRAVRLSWPSGSNRGREVLYRSDEPGGPMHVKMANPALPRLTLDPTSPMVMRNSRHPVTEAGFDSIVEGLERAARDPAGSGLAYEGAATAEGLDRPCDCLARTTPDGEHWRVYLDPRNHLPALVVATDPRGELLERDLFRDVQPDPVELARADAFDPDVRWGKPLGLFGRLGQ